MSESNPVFKKNYIHYLNRLKHIDLNHLASKLGIKTNDSKTIFVFNKKFIVTNQGFTDLDGKRPSYDICVILAKYILMCPDITPKEKDWVFFRDFKDSGPLAGYISNDVENKINRNFTGRTDALKRAERSERILNMDNQMTKTASAMLKDISGDEMREMIIKSRWTCDSHWMMSMVMNAGWDVANKINLEVCQRVGHVEMRRLITAMNLNKPVNNEEFMMMLKLAMEAFLPKDYFDYEFCSTESGRNIAIIHQCYSNTKLRSISAEKEYRCGCFGLRAGWYQALNVEVKEKLLKCLKEGDDCCEIQIEDIEFSSKRY